MKYLAMMVLALCVACMSAPPSLSPIGQRTYQADQAVLAIGQVQTAAIGLNKIQVCPPTPCHPVLSDANTAIVIDSVTSALNTMRVVPDGWKATTLTALMNIQNRLDASGKTTLAAYLEAARTIVNALL